MSSEERGPGLIYKTASSYKSPKKALFKKSKAKELFGLQIHPLKKLVSVNFNFDYDLKKEYLNLSENITSCQTFNV